MAKRLLEFKQLQMLVLIQDGGDSWVLVKSTEANQRQESRSIMTPNRRHPSYRAYLRDALKSRKISLSEFARLIGISPAFLSQVLNKRRGLSEERATTIVGYLKFSESESKYFCTLVRFENAKSAKLRSHLRRELDDLTCIQAPEDHATPLQSDTFSAISAWYHGAILELTELADYSPDVAWIAKKLKIQPIEAENALQRLIRLGLLSKQGRTLKKTNNNLVAGYVSSKAVRNYHRQMLTLATKALDDRPYEERDLRGSTIAISQEQLPAIKKLIDDVYSQVRQRERTSYASQLYHLSVQFFRLDHNLQMSHKPNEGGLHV